MRCGQSAKPASRDLHESYRGRNNSAKTDLQGLLKQHLDLDRIPFSGGLWSVNRIVDPSKKLPVIDCNPRVGARGSVRFNVLIKFGRGSSNAVY